MQNIQVKIGLSGYNAINTKMTKEVKMTTLISFIYSYYILEKNILLGYV